MNIDLSCHNVREVTVTTKESNGSTWTVLTIRTQWENLPEETTQVTLFHYKEGIIAPFLPEYAPVAKEEEERGGLMDANAEASAQLLRLLRGLWRHAEGVSNEDIKLLCWGCGIDSSTVMIPEPTPDTTYQGNMDSSVPF